MKYAKPITHEQVGKLRAALVASEAYIRSALFQQFASQYGVLVMVFNALDTARTWLDIDEEIYERTIQELRAQASMGRLGRV